MINNNVNKTGNHEIIVIGGNHHNTLGVLRALGRCGLSLHLILTARVKDPFVAKSKYAKTVELLHSHDDILPTLLRYQCQHDNKPIVIACHDIASSILDEHKDELQQYFHIPCSDKQGKLTHLMNKQTMAELARTCGLNVPETWVIDLDSPDIEAIEYPCITKPLLSKIGSKNDIAICNSREELEAYLGKRHCGQIQVQRFIKKKYEYQYIGCSLNSGEDMIIPGVSELIRPGNASNTGFLKYCTLDDSYTNLEECKTFLKATGYSGLFSLEFLRDEEGKDYFMEINFRNDGNGISVTNSGVNLPYVWYLANAGLSWKEEASLPIHTEYVMPEFTEYGHLACRRMTLAEFHNEMSLATSSMDYDPADPAPTNGKWELRKALAMAYIKYIIRSIIRK